MAWSACSSARCCWQSATSCSANGSMLRSRQTTKAFRQQTLPSDRLRVSPPVAECADQARDHHRKEQLAADNFEYRDPAGNIGARQDVAVTERRKRDEAVIDGDPFGNWIRAGKAAGTQAFDRPIDLAEE